MKRILIIGGNSSSAEDKGELSLFARGVRQAYPEATVETVCLDQLQVVIEPGAFRILYGKTNRELAGSDLVILRNKMRTYSTLAYCISRYCRSNKVQFFNDYSAYFSGTKVSQAVVFYEYNVPFLKTVYSLNKDTFVAAIKRELTLPFILKDALGAKGNSNYLVKTYDELEAHLTEEPDTDFLAQEYCVNDRDYRILIAGNSHVIFRRQGKAATHLNNTSVGGIATLAEHELPAVIVEQAHQLAGAMGLSIAGVDVMPQLNTDTFYFIETNSQPQLFTGVFLPEKQELTRKLLTRLLS